ncbi:hypothetical protein QQ045_014256 [Rhodiola kirilowii]
MGMGRCYAEAKPCIDWVQLYFNDCLCNLRDEVSFGLGIISVSFWGFAEVPQIVMNFKAKSSRGVSLLLLLTWIVGDVFNLAGCILEPSTLPTQFYTALLYTVGSSILTYQCIYYDHIVPWLTKNGKKDSRVVAQEEDLIDKPLLIQKCIDSSKNIVVHSPCPVPTGPALYTSARSLASSPSPLEARFPKLIEEQNKSNTHSSIASFVNQSRGVVNAVAGCGTFLAAAAAANLPNQTRAYMHDLTFLVMHKNELQNNLRMEDRSDPYGQMLGWGMAFIYITGRIPQLWLNMKRGNVEGLSPCMFIFALVANITYVLSILVRSCKWVDLKDNLPWLLDAAICLFLDFLILLQFIYYRYRNSKQNKYIKSPEAP